MPVPGRLTRAPEHFLDSRQIADAQAGRRGFLRDAFLAAAAAAGAGTSATLRAADGKEDGDPAILELPEHSRGLGQPVATRGYGSPPQHEKNLQRRESPRLTHLGGASGSFTPLHGLL